MDISALLYPLAGLVGFISSSLLNRKNELSKGQKEAIETWKSVAESNEKRLLQVESEVKELHKDNIKLKTMLDERDKKINDLLVILENRSPHLEEALGKLVPVATTAQEWMKSNGEMIRSIHDLLTTPSLK